MLMKNVLAVTGLVWSLLVSGCDADGSDPTVEGAVSPAADDPATGPARLQTRLDGVASFACDLWLKDCPEGEKCAAAASGAGPWDSLTCVPIAGDAALVGEPCTVDGGPYSGVDDCDSGAMCLALDLATGEGVCVAHCGGEPWAPTCADPDSACMIADDGVRALCLPVCDPLVPGCAREQEVCVPNPAGEEFVCLISAVEVRGSIAEACATADACDFGLVCLAPEHDSACDPNAPGCCLEFCDLGDPRCALPGAQCMPWFAESTAPPGLESVGHCGGS
jgi:hypothetical protein